MGERFKHASHAYEILSNPETRRVYDASRPSSVGNRQMAMPQGGAMMAQQPMQEQKWHSYQSYEQAQADPALMKLMKPINPQSQVDPAFVQSVDWLQKVEFTKALGGDLGAAVEETVGKRQPDWGNIIKKVGPLFWKSEENKWEPNLFFVYNGFLAACDVYEGHPATVEMSKLNLQVALEAPGFALPLPLKGCRIIAGGEGKHFSILVAIPGRAGKVKQIDLAAETVEAREGWLEEIFQAAQIGDGYGAREEYIPKKFRGLSKAELKAKRAYGDVSAGARSCADDTGCTLM